MWGPRLSVENIGFEIHRADGVRSDFYTFFYLKLLSENRNSLKKALILYDLLCEQIINRNSVENNIANSETLKRCDFEKTKPPRYY